LINERLSPATIEKLKCIREIATVETKAVAIVRITKTNTIKKAFFIDIE
jgi:hypothetical protein